MKSELSPREMVAVLFGLLLIFGIGLWITWEGPNAELSAAQFWYSDGLKWLIAGLLLVTVIFWERNSLSTIGFRQPSWLDWALVPLVAITMLLLGQLIGPALSHTFQSEIGTSTITFLQGLPLYQQIIIVITAGFTEETMYRGYTIERLEAVTNSTTLAAIISIIAFVAVHLPSFGVGSLILQTIMTIILTVVYVWRRNLVAPIGAHIIINAVGVIYS